MSKLGRLRCVGRGIVNEDFKLDLGNIDPRSSKARTKFKTSRGQSKSASQLTEEFLHLLIQRIRAWAENTNLQLAPAILVAEPLPSQEEPSWLSNYRSNISRILQGKGFEPKKIDFLPEPFAVFQYYRYGERNSLLLERAWANGRWTPVNEKVASSVRVA